MIRAVPESSIYLYRRYPLKVMEMGEFESGAIASAAMLALASYLAAMRLNGTPVFETLFEACLFYLPAAILLVYTFLEYKARRNSLD